MICLSSDSGYLWGLLFSSIFLLVVMYRGVQVRVQAIRGLPLFCKDRPKHIPKIVDILVQLLACGKLFISFSFLWGL